MDISFIFFVIILLINIFIGFIVFANGPKAKSNQYFFLLVVAITCWLFANFLENEPALSNEARTRLFILDFVFGVMPGIFFNIFCSYFPDNKVTVTSKIREITLLVFLFFCGFSVATTDIVMRNINFSNGVIDADPGQFFWAYLVFIFGTIGNGLEMLFSKYRRASNKIERTQIVYIFTGFLIFTAIAAFINLILGSFILIPVEIARIGIYSVVIFSIFTAVAITKYELFNIKLILTEILIGAIALVLLYQVIVTSNLQWKLMDGVVFILFCFFGSQLIIANEKEIRQRKEAEFTAMRERVLRHEAEDLAKNLKHLNQAKTQFLLSTQHHLRSPLTIIQGYLSMVNEGSYGVIPVTAKDKIQISLNATQKLINLVNEMLDVAHFQMNRGSVFKQPTDIVRLISGIIEDLAKSAESKGIYLRFEKKTDQFPQIEVDPHGVREAIYNIVDNAIKYTQEGGVTVVMEISKNTLRISVIDTGIGLSDHDRRNLFNRTFERGSRAKEINATGKGIGLYLAGQMIINNDGTIHAESEGRGKGATFIVELPMPEEDSAKKHDRDSSIMPPPKPRTIS